MFLKFELLLGWFYPLSRYECMPDVPALDFSLEPVDACELFPTKLFIALLRITGDKGFEISGAG